MTFYTIKMHHKGDLPHRENTMRTPRKQEMKKATIRRRCFVVCHQVAVFDGIVVVVGAIV